MVKTTTETTVITLLAARGVRPAAARDGVVEFLSDTQDPVHLAVIGPADAGKVARLIGPVDPHFGHAGRSVLVAR